MKYMHSPSPRPFPLGERDGVAANPSLTYPCASDPIPSGDGKGKREGFAAQQALGDGLGIRQLLRCFAASLPSLTHSKEEKG